MKKTILVGNPKTETVHVRLEKNLLEDYNKICRKQRVSKSVKTRQLIKDYVKEFTWKVV